MRVTTPAVIAAPSARTAMTMDATNSRAERERGLMGTSPWLVPVDGAAPGPGNMAARAVQHGLKGGRAKGVWTSFATLNVGAPSNQDGDRVHPAKPAFSGSSRATASLRKRYRHMQQRWRERCATSARHTSSHTSCHRRTESAAQQASEPAT